MATSDGREVVAPRQLVIPLDAKPKTRAISGMMYISGEAVYFFISGAHYQIPMG